LVRRHGAKTPASLSQHWSTQRERVGVIAFYQAREGIPWREFSNWYCKSGHGLDFVLPQQLLAIAGTNKPTDLAAVMGDAASYARIKASKTPKEAKILGRSVQNNVVRLRHGGGCSPSV